MDLENLRKKLQVYNKQDIIITDHASIQAEFRGISIEDVKENITNPKRLVFAEKQKTENPDDEKYDCYFAYNKTLCHRYISVLNRKVIIVTIIKINRDWQKIIESKKK